MIFISEHAYQRAKERMKLKRNSLNRIAERAFYLGICHKDTAGSLNKFITNLWSRKKTANNIRIYGDYIYFFSDTVLITLYVLPLEMRRKTKAFTGDY